MTLLKKFNQLKTLKEKRLFALKLAKTDYDIEMLNYEKLSFFSIHILFYKYIGKKYIIKRQYKPKHNSQRNF